MISRLLIFFVALSRLFRFFPDLLKPSPSLGKWLFTAKVMKIWVTAGGIMALIFFWIALIGPNMRIQPHYLPYEVLLPVPPEGIITVEKYPLWSGNDTLLYPKKEALSDTAGKIYYEYYCQFCHGRPGLTPGPVGESFIPTPTDLSLTRIQQLDEITFIQKMISGKSHIPLIPYVVPPLSRRLIAQYVLSF